MIGDFITNTSRDFWYRDGAWDGGVEFRPLGERAKPASAFRVRMAIYFAGRA
jgi:hypothetical protein